MVRFTVVVSDPGDRPLGADVADVFKTSAYQRQHVLQCSPVRHRPLTAARDVDRPGPGTGARSVRRCRPAPRDCPARRRRRRRSRRCDRRPMTAGQCEQRRDHRPTARARHQRVLLWFSLPDPLSCKSDVLEAHVRSWAAAQARRLPPLSAAAISSGNRSGVQAKAGTPSSTRSAASA